MVPSAPEFTTRPELQGHVGMVACTHYLGSAAGMAILERGGNAFDAAVATGFVLQVVEPHLNGPGGDMSLLFARDGGPVRVLCGQGPAPAAATIDAYRGSGLTEIPGSGLTAAAIPGSTLAWFTLLRDHGTLDLPTVLDAAIGYAECGFPVLPSIAATVSAVTELFLTEWTSSAAQYLPDGRAPQAGERLTNPALAATYRRLVAAAAGKERVAGIEAAMREWREGFVAEAIETFCRTPAMDSTGERHEGYVTSADLAAWQPRYEDPATVRFGDYTVAKTGPWGQGPVLLEQLAMLDGGEFEDLEPDSAEFVHTVVEGAKLAFADRNAFYGDSAEVPLGTLLSPDYAAARRALISATASLELRPGSPDGRTPTLPDYGAGEATGGPAPVSEVRDSGDVVRAATQGEPTVPDAVPDRPDARPGAGLDAGTDARPDARGRTRGDTCHLDVVDRWGNMVSATPSGGWLQSSPLIPDLGFPLGTRLQMMTLQPGLPTSLRPGCRPRTTLSPTMVSVGGDAVLACGTPGGDQQDQWQLPFLIRHLRERRNLQAAIDAPTFHTTHVPSSFAPHEAYPGQLVIESRFDDAVLDELRRRGHRVAPAGPWSLGRLSAVARDPKTGVLRAGANPRGMQGYAVGR